MWSSVWKVSLFSPIWHFTTQIFPCHGPRPILLKVEKNTDFENDVVLMISYPKLSSRNMWNQNMSALSLNNTLTVFRYIKYDIVRIILTMLFRVLKFSLFSNVIILIKFTNTLNLYDYHGMFIFRQGFPAHMNLAIRSSVYTDDNSIRWLKDQNKQLTQVN